MDTQPAGLSGGVAVAAGAGAGAGVAEVIGSFGDMDWTGTNNGGGAAAGALVQAARNTAIAGRTATSARLRRLTEAAAWCCPLNRRSC